jgi:hypothetical protein
MNNYIFKIYSDDKTTGYMGLLVNIQSTEELFWKIDELGFNPTDVEFKLVEDSCALSVPINIKEEEYMEEMFNYIENDVNDITFDEGMEDNSLNGAFSKFNHNHDYKIKEEE